jgi:hypothetical protein
VRDVEGRRDPGRGDADDDGTSAVVHRPDGLVDRRRVAERLEGSGATQFTIDGGSCGAQLAAGASCIITVRFTPDSTGSKNAALVVMANPGGVAISGLLGLAN